MKTLNRLLLGFVVPIALCLGLNDDSFAAPFTLISVDATWGNLQPVEETDNPPPFNIPGNPAFFNTNKEFSGDGDLIRSIVRWGEPSTENGPKSGLDYVPPPLGPIPTNAEHPFGTLQHINNPVFDPGVKLADLLLELDIADETGIPHDVDIILKFNITETPDSAPCPFPGTPPCSDKIALAGVGVVVDGKGSILKIEGFKEKLGGLTFPAPFIISDEGSGKQAFLVSRIVTDPNVIPEPSTVLLFGSGLAGLAAWRKFRGKYRTN